MKPWMTCAALGLVLVATPAWAAPTQVQLSVMVVEASQAGSGVEPRLAHMRDAFKKRGFAFTSYRLVSEPKAKLAVNAPLEVPLPGGRRATLTPTAIAPDGKVTVRAQVQGLMDVSYTVANGGVNYVGAGAESGPAQLFLVITHQAQ